jgi:hypothetical protein
VPEISKKAYKKLKQHYIGHGHGHAHEHEKKFCKKGLNRTRRKKMSWPPDIPDLPLKKPAEVAKLELLDSTALNAMRDEEIEEHIEVAASGFARSYKEEFNGNYEDCVSMVSSALQLTGSAIGGRFGTAMVARSRHVAEMISQELFPEPEIIEREPLP